MWKNYLTIIIRNIRNHRLYSSDQRSRISGGSDELWSNPPVDTARDKI